MANLKYDPSARFDVETSDVVYRQDGNTSWQATIYQPKGAGPFPGLLDVHGGAWSRGERSNDRVMNEALAASGIVVAAIDFRLAPDHPYPAQVVDTNFATRWFKAHAKDFNVDPQSIGGMGSSSGGHTVMLSAMRPTDPRYAALPLPEAAGVDASLKYLLCCWPVLDPYARYTYAKGAGEERLAASSEAYFLNEETMHEGNCQEILERGEKVELPPTLLIQGTNDSNVPLSIPQRFDEAYRNAGGHLELEMFPDQVHGFGNTPGPESDRAIKLMKGFIARQVSRAAAAV
ncbi:MAG: alpha/beta hydrolase [Chloroflexi bacterium]|nr:alpha/beta hydrolase [Chloroflexota bacterium]MDA1219613.1 alpha/beta hydrolase [Chloroflexota bacterium]